MTVTLVVGTPTGRAQPGDEASCTVTVRNGSPIVQAYDLHVLGSPATWARLDPPRVQLLPGEGATAHLTFHVPPGPATPAGAMPFAVQAMGQTDPTDAAVEEGTLTIAGVAAGVPELRPLRGRGRNGSAHTVFVENTGNVTGEFSMWAADPDELLEIVVKGGGSAVIAPGEVGELKLETKAIDRILFGRESRPFSVHVTDPSGAVTTIDGSLEQRGFPRWLVAVPVVLAALLLLALLRGCDDDDGTLALGTVEATTTSTTVPGPPAVDGIGAGDPGSGGAPTGDPGAGAGAPAGGGGGAGGGSGAGAGAAGGPAATSAPAPPATQAPPPTSPPAPAAPGGPSGVVVPTTAKPTTTTRAPTGPRISSVSVNPEQNATGSSTIATPNSACGGPGALDVVTTLDPPEPSSTVTVTFTPVGANPPPPRTSTATQAAPTWSARILADTLRGSDEGIPQPDETFGRTFTITIEAKNSAGRATSQKQGSVLVRYGGCLR